MKPFSLLIKPASADCNLRCPYCFYLKRSSLYPETARHRMPQDVLDRLVRRYMETEQPHYAFCWQGGEPTLMGLDFYKRVIELQQKYGRSGSSVANALQTNGLLLDDDFAAHFAAYNFLIGVSLDGPADIHDRFRVHAGGAGSHAQVLKAIERLKQGGADFNILTLVTTANVTRGKEVYNYLCNEGFSYHQYIPCVEFDEDNAPLPFTVSAAAWGDFLCEIFDEWIRPGRPRVSVRLFDAILMRMLNGQKTICHMEDNCSQYFVVEYNGDVYPCDFFVEEERKIGNTMTHSWQELLDSPDYRVFGDLKSEWNDECAECEFLAYCAGDCLKHRLYQNNDPKKLSWLCEGWKQFYKHSLPAFNKLARTIETENHQRMIAERQKARAVHLGANIGRNDPCPCGSGKKFKKCCGALK
jgi:uncharacterized protein